MTESSNSEFPTLIIVTGCPGSGKTTLAHALAHEVRCPAICRDEIKEGYINTTNNSGMPGDDITWNIYKLFFDTLKLLLTNKVTLIAEAAFQHKLWTPKLEQLKDIARIKIIICSIDPKLARSRFIKRGFSDPDRVKFHADNAVYAAKKGVDLPLVSYEPPKSPFPTLIIDTSDGYYPKIEEIVLFATE